MKTVFRWARPLLFSGLGCFIGGAIGSATTTNIPSNTSAEKKEPTVATTNADSSAAPAPSSSSPPSDFEKLRAARAATFQSNPALAAEYKQIMADMLVQQGRLDAAMLKAAPTLKPFMAKLTQTRGASTGSLTTAGNPTPSFSAEEWQEFHAARMAALHAHPDLIPASEKLNERIRALEDKLDAAMLKSNPAIAPTLAKYKTQ